MRLALQVDSECGAEDGRRMIEEAILLRLPEVRFATRTIADVVVRWTPGSTGCVVLIESADGVAEVPLRAEASEEARSEAAARVAWLAAIGLGVDPFDAPVPATPEGNSERPEGRDEEPEKPTPEGNSETTEGGDPSAETLTPEGNSETPEGGEQDPQPPTPEGNSETPEGGEQDPRPPTPEGNSETTEGRIAQRRSELEVIAFGASVMPAAAIPRRSRDGVRRGSVNLLMGETAGLDGFELGLGINREREFVRGLQLAGLANFVGGDVLGAQLAFGANFSGTGGEEGAAGELRGLQLAGGYNQALGGGTGLQWAAVNLSRQTFAGLQLGAANLAEDVRGMQFGFANGATGRVNGLQLGFVNYASESTVSVGIFSYVRSEPIRPTVTIDSTPLLFVGVRHGSRFVQNIIGFSVGATDATALGGFTYGVGTHFGRRVFVNLDLVYTALWGEASAISGVPTATGGTLAGHRLQPRASLGWQILPRFAVYAGAAESLFFTTRGTSLGLAPASLAPVNRSGGSSLYVYPDFHLGLRF